ncbi:MAG: hypothetical protein ACRDIB_00945 [Ardenticatenaceae bacterium]
MNELSDELIAGVHYVLRHLHHPARLEDSPWLDACLVAQRVQEGRATTRYQALREIFREVLDLLADESEEYADILRGRYWDRWSVRKMVNRNRPQAWSDRTFQYRHKEALARFARLLWTKEGACKRATGEPMEPVEEPRPRWAGLLLLRIGRLFHGLTSRKVLRAVAWTLVWLLGWRLTFPLLHWPFSSPLQVRYATFLYVGGALVLPHLVGGLVRTKNDEFWVRQNLASTLDLRLFTHVGAMLGFHLGYTTILVAALIGYYLGLGRVPRWMEGLAAIWPILLGYAAARRVPYNFLLAFDELQFTEGDRAVFVAATLFGPLLGGLFFSSYPLLLSPLVGASLILLSIAGLAGLTLWQQRAGRDVIPSYIWAAIFGITLLLHELTRAEGWLGPTILAGLISAVVILLARGRFHVTIVGGLGLLAALGLLSLSLNVSIWLGRLLTVSALLLWALWGRRYIWFPSSFWGVIAAAVGATLLWQWGGWPERQAIFVYGLAVLIILWADGRLPRGT